MARTSLLAAAAVALWLLGAAAGAQAADSVGLVDPVTGRWHLFDTEWGRRSFLFGDPGDRPVAGDWDGDGDATPGLYRQSDGFFYLRNTSTTGTADAACFAGNPADVPLAGDWDGDGIDTLGLYRPEEQRFYLFNRACGNAPMGAAEVILVFGNPGDQPVAGDWDGDGITEIGLYRESTGLFYWRNTLDTGIASGEIFFGDPGDRFAAGDWGIDDGRDTPGVYRPGATTFFFRHTLSQGVADSQRAVGSPPLLPVAGDFGDLGVTVPILGRRLVGNFAQPLLVTAPFGDPRLFVVEKAGVIRVVDGTVTRTFLDLRAFTANGAEQGLLGLAFHPDYGTNGRFFVHYTDNRGDSVLAEYSVGSDRNVADATSGRVVLRVEQPFSNHNGGMIAFGPDAYLYWALGDGGSGGDPLGHAQNPATLLGSILRIDVDGAQPYTVPGDNPFLAGGGAPEVWSYGLRNPWRFSFDGGEVWIGDVGQNRLEEVDRIIGPANLGWNRLEGSRCFPTGEGCTAAGTVLPVVEYPTGGASCSVIGGYVYRGTTLPGLAGHYLYGDFCGGFVRTLRMAGAVVAETWDATAELGVVPRLSSFGRDGLGELYVMSLDGPVYAIVAG